MHMRIFFLVSFWCLSLGVLWAQQPLSSKRPPTVKANQKGDYQRYETEDVLLLREKANFRTPDPKKIVIRKSNKAPIEVFDTIDKYQRVSPYFENGELAYIDVSRNVELLTKKHTAAQAVATEVQPTTTPTYTGPRLPTKVRGYRLQLFNGQDREQANRIKNQFISYFPDVPRYLMYVEPTYRVRVGDFYTRDDADALLREAKKYFPDAIIIRDIVTFKPPTAAGAPQPQEESGTIEENK